jgi:Na+/H+ antiporter NhaD/arsenite permease-like protein
MHPSEWQAVLTYVVFGSVILAIAFDVMDMALAALLGVSLLSLFGIFTGKDVQDVTVTLRGPLALLFGGMVVARLISTTGIFDNIGTRFLIFTKGSGRRFLVGLVFLVAAPCAFLPNATTVILIAPIIIRVAKALDVDFIGPMVLAVIVSNSAGLLTLVGDPATFLIGSSIGMTFMQYLMRVSLGGLCALLVILFLMPFVLRDVWNVRRDLPSDLKPEPIRQPVFTFVSLLVLGVMVLLFLFGEQLPVHVLPPAVAIIAATLSLLVIYEWKIDSVEKVLKDVDWKTLIFLACLFFLVQAFTKTGILQRLSVQLHMWFGTDLLLIAMVMIFGIAFASSLLANIPIVAAMILLLKGYFVEAEMVPELAMAATFTDWPEATLPVFVAMMFGATLGGNATLIGASANVVGAGICAANGRPLKFMTFLRHGVPVTACQLIVAALYVIGLRFVLGH